MTLPRTHTVHSEGVRSVQEAKDDGNLALVPTPDIKEEVPKCVNGSPVLYLQGLAQLTQEAKRITTHHCRAPAYGSRAGGSIPPTSEL